jgi:hypothetical protein
MEGKGRLSGATVLNLLRTQGCPLLLLSPVALPYSLQPPQVPSTEDTRAQATPHSHNLLPMFLLFKGYRRNKGRGDRKK